MPSILRAMSGGACALTLLAGCNQTVDSSNGGSPVNLSASGSTTTSTSTGAGTSGGTVVTGITGGGGSAVPSADVVNATPSVAGTVSVIPGAKQSITVAFTSADGRPISGLALSSTTLPADWSGPSAFTCTVSGSGNNCVLTLTYAPTSVETGTLSIGYVYAGDQLAPPGATVSIPYSGTATNNVVATSAPIGQINAASGAGTQTVIVNFTTDDGNTATDLAMISSLSGLPAGWSAAMPGFTCAIVSNGSGCQLVLSYAPKTAGSGTLMLSYGYADHSGMARTGAINLPYSTTANGNVVATVSPAGQVNAVQQSGTRPVTITFTTDDGKTASGLSLLGPLSASLPAGWTSSMSGFKCAAVSTGSGCQLTLSYAPATLTSGTVQLAYGYTSAAGVFTTGSVNVPYAATTHDNVIATAAPSGQIDAIAGEVTPDVLLTFTTDDTRTATQLQLTTDLTSLPAGWTSTDAAFSCAGVTSGTTCQLPLHYAPTGAASGTLTLRYTYLDNAGQPKSGSLNIPFRSNTDNTIQATPSPTALNVVTGTSTMLAVTFVTDDGNPASALSVTSGLTALPPGFTAAGTFTCAGVSAGSTCQLPLTYQPTGAGAGTLTLGFTYLNNAGQSKTGSVSIPYRATTNDSVHGTASLTPVNAVTGTSTMLTVMFATDDGNPASALSVTSGLATLPAGWTGAGTFACAAVSAGSSCQLPLTYLPTVAATGTLTLGFTYTDDSGTVKTGTVIIPYAAGP